MIREIFDIPDSDNATLARAELFLRERIEELGGELLKKLEAHGFGEYPSFEARFYLPELSEEEEIDPEGQDISHEYSSLYAHLNALHEEYGKKFARFF